MTDVIWKCPQCGCNDMTCRCAFNATDGTDCTSDHDTQMFICGGTPTAAGLAELERFRQRLAKMKRRAAP